MSTHPVQMLDPVFRLLDDLIRNHGDLLYMGLIYAAIPLCAWILFGGARRKDSAQQTHTSVIVIHAPVRPPPQPPPIIGSQRDSTTDADEDSFAA
ncbi:MAG: hypothetical protein U1F83_01045 [Verrucomicrobiota bacterium]